MIENYNGWKICINREDGLSDVIVKSFKFGKYRWVTLFIHENDLQIVSSAPFVFQDMKITSTDMYSKCNESDDLFRAQLTELHNYLIELVNQLPDI